jgi:COP9 signalosome complex subunit 6
MDDSSFNPLISGQKSSQLHAVLHPLVLLTISDYITRHTLREQTGPIIGALLGQQNGREITVEHAFECHLREVADVEGGYLLDETKFAARLEQSESSSGLSFGAMSLINIAVIIVHKDRQLDFVGWYTLLPAEGPTPTILPIHNQILERWNEGAILLAFHPQEVLHHSVGGKLPLTIFESNYEADESRGDNDGEDKKMDDGEPPLKLKFREVPYSVETDETEMISMNYVAGSGGSAAAVAAKDDKPARSVESNGKGKRRLIESELEELKSSSAGDDDSLTLTREEEETISTVTAKANAIKMLQSRIQLLVAYLERLPPSFINGEAAESCGMDTDGVHTTPSLTVLRQIKALIGRLDLVIPSDDESFEKERATETNDVNVINMLGTLMQSVGQARDVGKKFNVVESSRASQKRGGADYAGGAYNVPGAGDLLI